jgi:hypothetical protein
MEKSHDRPEPSGADSRETTREALERAARHGRAALGEALAAVHALLDAASLATSGVPSASHRRLAAAAQMLEELSASLAPGDDRGLAITETLADALDAEIARWEGRAAEDPEARAVLRAFLGLREVLWEIGVRRSGGANAPPPRPSDDAPRSPRRDPQRKRVERVRVQG